jgi:hypothetical protein
MGIDALHLMCWLLFDIPFSLCFGLDRGVWVRRRLEK